MADEIRISIPAYFLDVDNEELEEVDLREYLDRQLHDAPGDRRGPLMGALDAEMEDFRSHLDELKVEAATIHDDDSVEIEYRIAGSVYMGCSDANYSDVDNRGSVGVRDGDDWIFKPFVAPVRIPPDMEGRDDD